MDTTATRTGNSKNRRHRRGVLTVAVLALLTIVLAACQPDPYVGPSDGPKLAVVGDSLIDQSREQMSSTFVSEGWFTSVTGRGGYTSRDHWTTQRAVMETDPQVVVLALGSNDFREIVTGLQTWDGFRASVRESLSITRAAPCLVWVGVTQTYGFFGGPADGNLDQLGWIVNVIIQQELAASRRPAGSTFYADWAAESRGRAEYFNGPGDIHLNDTGDAAYARLVDSAVDRCPVRSV